MKTKLTIIGATNREVNRAVSLLRHLNVPNHYFPADKLPENTVGDSVEFEIDCLPWMRTRLIDSFNSHFVVSNVGASIGVAPNMDNIDIVNMVGKYITVDFTGILVMAKISKITQDRYCYNFFYEFVCPSQVNWGENGYTKGVATLRKMDDVLLGSLVILN